MAKRRAHQRNLARARAKRRAQHRTESRRRRMIAGGGGLLALLVAVTLVAALLPRQAPVEIRDESSPESSPDPQQAGGVACGGETPAAAPNPAATFAAAPTPDDVLESSVDYRATLVTSCGDVVVDLYEDRAPQTVANFVFLARQDFYDGVTFHRVVRGFVIQGGDPTGTGGGGPGYQFQDELDLARDRGYEAGSLAMANSGPDTNGSQFFIVLEGGGAQLEPRYNLFGQVIQGMDVAERIGEVPVDSQQPLQTIYIEDVVIHEMNASLPSPTPTGGDR